MSQQPNDVPREPPQERPPKQGVNWEVMQRGLGELLALQMTMEQHSRAFSEKARLSSSSRERREEMVLVGRSYQMAATLIAKSRELIEGAAEAGGVDLVRGSFSGSVENEPSGDGVDAARIVTLSEPDEDDDRGGEFDRLQSLIGG